ncbi:hypothetical protein [Streptomyces sp. G45]|uniref:hypothetical protein n=1 Tax=Streptomyces sp. G45 TaxID=3406627 RepID=UPI003C151515
MTERTERDDLLDFPGADELIAAGAVPPPPPHAIAAVRRRLALPPAPTATAPPAAPEAPLIVLGHGAPPPAARHSRRRVLIAAAAVAAVAAGAASYPVLRVDGTTPASQPSAAPFLNKMADISAQQPLRRPTKYWRVRYETAEGNKVFTRTWYTSIGGEGLERKPDGKLYSLGISRWSVGASRFSPAELEKLSIAPELSKRLPRDPRLRFRQAVELLEHSPGNPHLRSALYKVLARIPGATLTGATEDSRGRPGTGITFVEPHPSRRSFSCVIDPKNGRVLEDRSTPLKGPTSRTTYLDVGWVNDTT